MAWTVRFWHSKFDFESLNEKSALGQSDLQTPSEKSNRDSRLLTDGGETTQPGGSTAQVRNELTLQEVEAVFNSLPVGILVVGPVGEIENANYTVTEDTGYYGSNLIGRNIDFVLDFGQDSLGAGESNFEEFSDNIIQSKTTGILKTIDDHTSPVEISVVRRRGKDSPEGYILIYQLLEPDAAHRKRRQKERLGLINQFNSILRMVTTSIIHSPNQSRLERQVCKELATAPPYEFVFIAEEGLEGEAAVVPREWAGIKESDLMEMIAAVESNVEKACPIDDALSTGVVQTASDLDRNPEIQECFSSQTRSPVSSVAVSPIENRETVYGVLAVYSNRSNSFEDYEVRMLEDLGSIIGFVYNSIEQQEVMISDTMIELEFELYDRLSFYAIASEKENCSIEVEKTSRDSNDELLYYHRMDGISPERVQELVADAEYIEQIEILRQRGRRVWTVSQLAQPSIVEMLAKNNVQVNNIVAESGIVTLTVQIHPSQKVSTVTDILDTTYDDYELVAKRRRSRGSTPVQQVFEDVFETLTEKQRNAIVTAMQSGYFERPRKATVKEIASQLGLARSTFHQHLQDGLRKLVHGAVNSQSEYRPRES